MKAKIKTIDIQAKEWFDKVNGNSYFSATVTINFGLKSEESFFIPLHYGYGDQYSHEAFKQLIAKGYFKNVPKNIAYCNFFEENKIIFRASIYKNCLKRELSY